MSSGGRKACTGNEWVKSTEDIQKTFQGQFTYSVQGIQFTFTQPAITCLKLTIETLEQEVKYVQS